MAIKRTKRMRFAFRVFSINSINSNASEDKMKNHHTLYNNDQ